MADTNCSLYVRIHSGTTAEGENFSQFLGDEEYNDRITTPFDDFLHAAFHKWFPLLA
jgi:hypothetical protein